MRARATHNDVWDLVNPDFADNPISLVKPAEPVFHNRDNDSTQSMAIPISSTPNLTEASRTPDTTNEKSPILQAHHPLCNETLQCTVAHHTSVISARTVQPQLTRFGYSDYLCPD